MGEGALRTLYLCYASLEDPLIQTQVVAYLEGLAGRGHVVHLLTYEPAQSRARARELRAQLAARGIVWHRLRYHKRPSLPATIFDALAGAALGCALVLRHRLDAVHARSHVPAATALIVRGITRRRMIFDVRGLLGEEYVDAGRWPRDGVAHRLTTRVQDAALRRSHGVVTLTERVRTHLFGADEAHRATVIPCCADLERLEAAAGAAGQLRTELGLDGRRVVVYVGKLTEPYLDREMADFVAVARETDPDLALLVVTQAQPDSLSAELQRAGVPDDAVRFTRSAPQDLGAHLAVADFAISFCRPSPARIASSPTKLGEYLGAGLPIVSGPDIGDMDAILRAEEVGVVVDDFTLAAYTAAYAQIRRLAGDPGARERCRRVARQGFSLRDVGVPRYDALYRELARRP